MGSIGAFILFSALDRVVGRLFGDADVVRMALDEACIGDAHELASGLQIADGCGAAVAHAAVAVCWV